MNELLTGKIYDDLKEFLRIEGNKILINGYDSVVAFSDGRMHFNDRTAIRRISVSIGEDLPDGMKFYSRFETLFPGRRKN